MDRKIYLISPRYQKHILVIILVNVEVLFMNISKNDILPHEFKIQIQNYLQTNPVILRWPERKSLMEIYLRDHSGNHVLPSTIMWGAEYPTVIFTDAIKIKEIDGQDLVAEDKLHVYKIRRDWGIEFISVRCVSVSEVVEGREFTKRFEQIYSDKFSRLEDANNVERELFLKEKNSLLSLIEKMNGKFDEKVDAIYQKYWNELGMLKEQFMDKFVQVLKGKTNKVAPVQPMVD